MVKEERGDDYRGGRLKGTSMKEWEGVEGKTRMRSNKKKHLEKIMTTML